jgi:hypothetical protein
MFPLRYEHDAFIHPNPKAATMILVVKWKREPGAKRLGSEHAMLSAWRDTGIAVTLLEFLPRTTRARIISAELSFPYCAPDKLLEMISTFGQFNVRQGIRDNFVYSPY